MIAVGAVIQGMLRGAGLSGSYTQAMEGVPALRRAS
jgi:hypothetical protein